MKTLKILVNILAAMLMMAAFVCLFSEGTDGNLTIWNFVGLVCLLLSGFWFYRSDLKNMCHD